jgi:hypothetical protein
MGETTGPLPLEVSSRNHGSIIDQPRAARSVCETQTALAPIVVVAGGRGEIGGAGRAHRGRRPASAAQASSE